MKKLRKETKSSLNQQSPTVEQCTEHLTFDDYAEEYLKYANIDSKTYKSDVHTAFVLGMMKCNELRSVG